MARRPHLGARGRQLRTREGTGRPGVRAHQRRPVHLEAEGFDLVSRWVERYRSRAEKRFLRLNAVLSDLQDDTPRGAWGCHDGRVTQHPTPIAR